MASQQLLLVRFDLGEDREKRGRTKKTVKRCRHRDVWAVVPDDLRKFCKLRHSRAHASGGQNSFIQLNMCYNFLASAPGGFGDTESLSPQSPL